jgi:hypothetical protein
MRSRRFVTLRDYTMHCFRRVENAERLVIRIRELSRLEHDMQQDWSRLTNQLRDQIHRYYAQLLRLSPAADEPWIWELLQMAPLPAQPQSINPAQKRRVVQRKSWLPGPDADI